MGKFSYLYIKKIHPLFHIVVLFLIFYSSGINNGPDRLEKDLGLLFITNPEAAKIDWYSQDVINFSNVYYFYGILIKSLSLIPINLEILRLIAFIFLQLFSYYLILVISKRIVFSFVPGQLYAATICLLPSFWVNPGFLGYDGGLSPRALSTTLFLLAIKFLIEEKLRLAFIVSGLSCLFHPSHGLLIFLVSLSCLVSSSLANRDLPQLIKSSLRASMFFLISGGWFPLLLAKGMASELEGDQYLFHSRLIANFRHPFMPVDQPKVTYLLIGILLIFICLKLLNITNQTKIVVQSICYFSAFLIVLFWVGVELGNWLLVGLFAFRLETVITFFALLLFYKTCIDLVKGILEETSFFILALVFILPLSLYRFDFQSPASRTTFKSDFLSGAASQAELTYAWNYPRCFISPPGIQFPFSVAQFKVSGFSPNSGASWFKRLSIVSNVDLEGTYIPDGEASSTDMTEVQTTLNNGFKTLSKSELQKVMAVTSCTNFFLPKEFRHLAERWDLALNDDSPDGFYHWQR
jgi:hypothetical protein